MTIHSLTSSDRNVLVAVFTIIAIGFCSEYSFAADALTLKDFLGVAVSANETTRLNQTLRTQTEAKKDEAAATMMPQVKGMGSYVRQDTSQNSSVNANNSSAKLNLTQPLLGLYKNRSALEYAQSQVDVINYSGDDAILQLKLSLNEAFHSVLSAVSDVQNDLEIRAIAEKRVKEVTSRVKIGRSRIADLYAAQAQLATAEAQLEQAKSAEMSARNLLSQLSGLSPETPIVDSLSLPGAVDPLDRFVSSTDTLPSVRFLNAQKNATDLQIKAIRDQTIPDLDFVANYYLHREAPLDNVRWDVGMQLTWAIYDGGLIAAKVRETQAQTQMYDIQINQKKRVTDLKIRQSYDQYAASVRQIPILERSLSLAKKSYESIENDYRLGLTTILDLIQSYNTVATAKQHYNHQLLTAKASLAALQLNAWGQTL